MNDTTLPSGGKSPGEQSPGSSESAGEQVFYPAITVVLLQFGLLAGVGIVVLGLILTNSDLIGNTQLTNILLLVVGFVVVLALLRLLVKMLILRRTVYVISEDDLRREYNLLYKRRSREVPLQQLRGMEYQQSRLQTVLGYGNVVFLTGGTNQSLGFLEFEHVNAAKGIRDKIRSMMPEYG